MYGSQQMFLSNGLPPRVYSQSLACTVSSLALEFSIYRSCEFIVVGYVCTPGTSKYTWGISRTFSIC